MKESKTYRVRADIVSKIIERTVKYVSEEEEIVEEAEIVNAMIRIGLKEAENKDIKEYLELRENNEIK